MSIDEKKLKQMIKDSCRDCEARLETWIEVAEEALKEEGVPREEIYTFLFWSQTEFHRRRAFLEMEEPEIEYRGSRALREIERRAMEARRSKEKAGGHHYELMR